jgi:hypothetical protein
MFDELVLLPESATRIREQVLADRHIRLRQTFASYAAERAPDSLWDQAIVFWVPGFEPSPTGHTRMAPTAPEPPVPLERYLPRDRETLRKYFAPTTAGRATFTLATATSILATS